MTIVIVEYFLNNDGIRFFPEWINEISKILQQFEGFHSIKQIKNIDEENECHLLLKFQNTKTLRQWASSKDHEDFIKMLIPYRIKKHLSQIFEEIN